MRIIFPDKYRNSKLGHVLEKIPLIVFLTSCLAPIFSYLASRLFGFPTLIEYLSLSVSGIQKHRFWQFLTYPFVTADTLCIYKEQCVEVSQRLLIRNTLCFIFFYKSTKNIIAKLGPYNFLFFSLAQTLSNGLFIWILFKLCGSSQALFGPECLICSLILISVFLDPEKRTQLGPLPLTVANKWIFLVLLAFYCFLLTVAGAVALLLGSIFSMALAVAFCRKEKIPNPYQIV